MSYMYIHTYIHVHTDMHPIDSISTMCQIEGDCSLRMFTSSYAGRQMCDFTSPPPLSLSPYTAMASSLSALFSITL